MRSFHISNPTAQHQIRRGATRPRHPDTDTSIPHEETRFLGCFSLDVRWARPGLLSSKTLNPTPIVQGSQSVKKCASSKNFFSSSSSASLWGNAARKNLSMIDRSHGLEISKQELKKNASHRPDGWKERNSTGSDAIAKSSSSPSTMLTNDGSRVPQSKSHQMSAGVYDECTNNHCGMSSRNRPPVLFDLLMRRPSHLSSVSGKSSLSRTFSELTT